MFVCVYMFMWCYTCIIYVCMGVHVHLEAKKLVSGTIHLVGWDCSADWWVIMYSFPENLENQPVSSGITIIYHQSRFFMKVPGLELKSPYLCGKHCTN